MSSIILVVVLIGLTLLGLPIAFSLGMSGIVSLVYQGVTTLMVFPQRIWTTCDSFAMLAVLFFIISGELMLQGGISRRLINFVKVFFRWVRGSLAVISLVSCAFFGALSGSALATTAAIGGIMYPEMTKKGNNYGEVFSATLLATGGTLGTMIPPSITLILYANVTNASVADLFIAVIVPGLIMMCCYIAASYYYMLKRGIDIDYKEKSKEEEEVNIIKAFREGIWAILMPVIVLGGIYSGIFTPTESAIVACIYALFVGIFIYKELDFKIIYEALVKSAIITSTILLLCATANFFGWVLAILNIPAKIMDFFNAFMTSRYMFLFVINVLFLIAGMFIDTSVAILLIIPLVYRIAASLGINLVHFGVIACINLSMGMVTPPFGTSLFVSANMTGQRIEAMYKEVIPYCLAGIVGILLVSYIEPIAMFLIK